jgi:hypothetical protein
MKLRFVVFLTMGVFLLLLSSLIPSTPTGAHPLLQATITPTFFNYLPFVVKNWEPATPPTPSLCLPELGDWTGQESQRDYQVSFTVTSQCEVHEFSIRIPFGAGSCQITIGEDLPIDDNEFSFDFTGGSISGDFDSSTSASGAYSVFFCEDTLIIPPSEGTWEAHK